MRKLTVLFGIVVLLSVGCAGRRPLVGEPKGPKTVVFLSDGTAFRDAVVAHVSDWLRDSGYLVVLADKGSRKYYRAASYGAVVYVAEYWAWHTPRHAIRYWKKNGRARNIVFFITAGDPDLAINAPFDAVTTPSRDDRIVPAALELRTRLEALLR
jgi:hypothetical protein